MAARRARWGDRVARGWAIGGVGERTREAVTAAAEGAGLPVGAWVDKALTKALAEGLEAGVSIEEIEARLRQVVTAELEPMRQALARLEAAATAPTAADDRSPSGLWRERRRPRRQRGRA